MEHREIVVVGGGPAGLAAAAELRMHGVDDVLVLEAGSAPGARWRDRYDRLHLHTPRLLSGLPGYRIPRAYGRWVSRDDVISYLGEYALHHRLDLRTGTRVDRIDSVDGGWQLETSAGTIAAERVVVATGFSNAPRVPDWPGRGDFAGEFLHSSEYRHPEPFAGKTVLVVGSGNSGTEIAVDLAEARAARVWLSVRTPPQITRRDTLGLPAQALGITLGKLPRRWVDPISRALRRISIPDLSEYGLPRPREGLGAQFARTGTVPVLDVGFVDAVRSRKIEIVPAVEAFAGREVLLAGGTRVAPDVVVAATGFRPALEPLVGHLGVLDERGLPRKRAAPGLYFIGFWPTLGGMLRQLRFDARELARGIAAERAPEAPEPAPLAA